MIRHVSIIISGLVQGVGFRWWAKNTATSLGIKGFVKNLPDMTVYIEAEGESSSLKKFTDLCKIGPPSAIVKDVKVVESEPKGYSNFQITR